MKPKNNSLEIQELTELKKKIIADKIKDLVLADVFSFPTEELCKEFKISKAQLFNIKNRLILELPKVLVSNTKRKFNEVFDKLESIADTLVNNSESNDDLRKNIDITLKIIKEKTDYLERFHFKEKAIEQVTIKDERQLVIDNVIDV
jgi:hypothetical protein